MDFFARQTHARAQTRRLVALFVLCVVVVDVAVTAGLVMAYVAAARDADALASPQWLATHLQVIGAIAVLVLTVIVMGAAVKTVQLGGGGAFVARTLGGDPIAPDTSDAAKRRLLNVVEEISIASGSPVPTVYVLDHEAGLNAFAAGYTPADSVIAVTRGAIERLDRDELQGVLGHEFSHIVNGDMRLNMRLMGLVAGLFAVAAVGRVLLRIRGRKGGPFVLAGLVMLALGYVGFLAGRMIQAAISRQREFLADAASVQFTRDPTGLKDALVKIGAYEAGSRLESHAAGDVAHMLIATGLDGPFATHPPLVERIRALDPSFQEEEFERVAKRLAAETRPALATAAGLVPRGRGATESLPAVVTASALATEPARLAVQPASVSASVGRPRAEHVEAARAMRESLPDDLRQAGAETTPATSMLWALVLDADPGVRAQELDVLRAELGEVAARDAAASYEQVTALPPIQRLPMLQRLVPTLGRLPLTERERILRVIDRVVNADGSVRVSEYALARLARVYLGDQIAPPRTSDALVVADVVRDLQTLLTALARFGHADRDTAERAYDHGMEHIVPVAHLPYAPRDPWIGPLDQALDRLDQLMPPAKQRLVEALVITVSHDGRVSVEEAELLRTICATIHCPLPPIVAG